MSYRRCGHPSPRTVRVSASMMQSAAELWGVVTQASLTLGGVALLAGLVAWQTQKGRAWMNQTWLEFKVRFFL